MNLQQPNANEATQTANRSRSVSPVSGICTRCIDGCRGNCETFKATFRGREVIYPGPFGTLTAGGDKNYPIDYSHLNIAGYALGAKGLPEGQVGHSDNTLFPMVSTETQYGVKTKVKMKLPIFTGRPGLDRDRPQELGAFRRRRRDFRHHHRLRRERLRHRSRA